MEDLQAKHRKEQRDLQARITQKKKSATKKTRKGVNDECESWQRELLERQQAEIAQLDGDPPAEDLDDLNIADDSEAAATSDGLRDADSKTASPARSTTPSSSTLPSQTGPKKPSRQKARLARRAAEREADAAAAASEAANQVDRRSNEKEAMQAVFTRLALTERDIAPDGHCLYSAVATQLAEVGLGLRSAGSKNTEDLGADAGEQTSTSKVDGYKSVRQVTGKYVLAHADDFSAFIEEPLDEYARKIMFTAEWGGQLELQAMARAYGVEINVIQGDGRIEKFEPGDTNDEGERKKIWLAYYRHSYGLGEHYNALSQAA
ncbi:predicted protein [Uncinocarpus reesii 1704]|uniref:OTU domain-containing protein n=1 Tax=Uncinocarpus reesii (strain UAMH 1704) TaxID=336963 RepID=C4JWH3_UNCRE|nr:uncharacterized protein UREG_06915 [Uncinocarpus reesii 1704]EEP82050.1 predicted protein [Uncinocarpus reesii 1704]